jgi:hypothetical protein
MGALGYHINESRVREPASEWRRSRRRLILRHSGATPNSGDPASIHWPACAPPAAPGNSLFLAVNREFSRDFRKNVRFARFWCRISLVFSGRCRSNSLLAGTGIFFKVNRDFSAPIRNYRALPFFCGVAKTA